MNRIITGILMLILCITHANANCELKNPVKIKTDSNEVVLDNSENECNVNHELIFNQTNYLIPNSNIKVVSKKNQLKKSAIPKINLNLLSVIASFLSDLVSPAWGEYTEAGQNTAAPLLMFDNKTWQNDVAAIQSHLNSNNDFIRSTYEIIYKNVIDSGIVLASPAVNGNKTKFGTRSLFAKNCAFILLIGKQPNGTDLSTTQKNDLRIAAASLIASSADDTPDDFFESRSIDWGDFHQWRSRELINYCSAFELLRAENPSTITQTHKNSLKNFTSRLYKNAAELYSSLSKIVNGNIPQMTSGALYCAAVTLHGEKDFLLSWSKHPDKWARKAVCRVNQSMFTSPLRTMSDLTGIGGYDENGGYFIHAMECVIPMMTAYENFRGTASVVPRIYREPIELNLSSGITWLPTLLTGYEMVGNYRQDPRWKNVFNWYVGILQPNGTVPTCDDTRLNQTLPQLAALKDSKYSVLSGTNLTNFIGGSVYGPHADFLAANNFVSNNSRLPHGNYSNPLSGDHIIRLKDKEGDEFYMHGLCEPILSFKGFVVNQFSNHHFSHEHADATSIDLSVTDTANNTEMLIIDPPYYGFDDNENINL